ncbi:acyl-CoA synthetase (AMP-forming)/AMP-acid ligase II [Neobacillus ginsengisoli]|uniref:Acyl-CoA synthetase (AMP-forming)/AMP-acid ligase II n=2 Tax=Neobacillus ginsengisoli TaxID=904295 RepID=A0ABT9XTQ6_9BACI|nr:acyl-CoA synthetase (AMP-forming)/AMP-acid ligase II [Neobacillus ginsengisoli]
MLPNSPHYIFTLFSTFRLGGIAVQVNPMYVEREIEHVLNDSDSEYIVVLDSLYPKVKKLQSNTSIKKVLVVSFGGTRIDLDEGDRYFDEFLHEEVNIPEVEINRRDDVALLQYTGDVAKMDEEGYFYILDRKKDVIIASGYNVYPREIEEVLYQLEAIEEALIIGVSDTYRGETVKAYVKLKEGYSITAEEIKQYGKENLAPYKAPKDVEILSELPKSSVGKLLRRVLREEESAKVKA